MIKSLLGSVAAIALFALPAMAQPPGNTTSLQVSGAAGAGNSSSSSGVIGGSIGGKKMNITETSVTTSGASSGQVVAANSPNASSVTQNSNTNTATTIVSTSKGKGAASAGIGGSTANNMNQGFAFQGSVTLPSAHFF